MKKLLFSVVSVAAVVTAAPASAATTFFSTFESVPGGPTTDGSFTNVAFADGWTGGSGGIELQRRAAGDPAPDGGDVFVELDTTGNSSIFRTIDAGVYDLSFLYSPRPGLPASTNGIQVLLNGTLLTPPGTVTGDGGANTSFATIATRFTATGSSVLTFQAVGTSDSLGGYIDNISLSGVPEPTTWSLMILGFGAIGGAMRSRRRSTTAAVTA